MVEIIDIGDCKINRHNKIAKIALEGQDEIKRLEECLTTLDIKQKQHESARRIDIDQSDLEKLKRKKENIETILGRKDKPSRRKNKKNIVTIDFKKAVDLKSAVNERICEFERDIVRPRGGVNNLNEKEKEEYDKLWQLLKQLNKLKTDLNTKKQIKTKRK